MRWFLNLCSGLDRLGVAYRVNDYRGLRRHPGTWAHVVGKPQVVEKIPLGHPIIYGPGIASHPYDNDFWGRANIRLMLVSCDWFKAMCDRDLPCPVPTAVWPAGIDTDLWKPPRTEAPSTAHRSTDFLIYDKVRWEHDRYEGELIQPIWDELQRRNLSFVTVRYGFYQEKEFHSALQRCRAMIFLCEHETQGFAYLQALSSGVPIFAWDRGGLWKDPDMYPHRVQFAPVTSVPYFDSRCGMRFEDLARFQKVLPQFWDGVVKKRFAPRSYVVENFDLAGQARKYLELSDATQKASKP